MASRATVVFALALLAVGPGFAAIDLPTREGSAIVCGAGCGVLDVEGGPIALAAPIDGLPGLMPLAPISGLLVPYTPTRSLVLRAGGNTRFGRADFSALPGGAIDPFSYAMTPYLDYVFFSGRELIAVEPPDSSLDSASPAPASGADSGGLTNQLLGADCGPYAGTRCDSGVSRSSFVIGSVIANPEPGSVGLVALGLAALGAGRWMRRRAVETIQG